LTKPKSGFGSCLSVAGRAESGLQNAALTISLSEEEAPMNDRSGQSFMKRQIKYQKKSGSTKPGGRIAEREDMDERLDEALRQTFPASDALSIIQNVRGS
jgi:hypothetical protein